MPIFTMGFTSKLTDVKADYKKMEVTMSFAQALPQVIDSRAILFNHRFGTRNFIIKIATFTKIGPRALLCNTTDGLVENIASSITSMQQCFYWPTSILTGAKASALATLW